MSYLLITEDYTMFHKTDITAEDCDAVTEGILSIVKLDEVAPKELDVDGETWLDIPEYDSDDVESDDADEEDEDAIGYDDE